MAIRVRLTEEQAQAVLLVRAFEEADGDGRVLLYRDRQGSLEADSAGAASADVAATGQALHVRARRLQGLLDGAVSWLPNFRRVTRLAAGLGPITLLGGFLLGLSTSALGPARSINLLSFPLLGLLAWNLFVVALFVLLWVVRGGRRNQPTGGLSSALAPLLTFGYLKRAVSALQAYEPSQAALVRRALSSFLTLWRPVAAPLVAARGRRLFHLGALALMAGVVGSMYLRGLVLEYRVSWESTFLDGEGVHRLLSLVLAPALTLTGQGLPVTDLESLRGPAGSGEAAPWIHLFALSAALLVLLPRGLLALTESVRIHRLARGLELELSGPYFRRLLAAGRGERREIVLIPYSFAPARRHLEALQTALLDLFGSRCRLRLVEPLAYGDEALPGASDEAGAAALEAVPVVLFNLAQTPEEEVHAELLQPVAATGGTVLAVVDAAAYRQRLGEGEGTALRLRERRKAWSRVFEAVACPVAHVDLETMDSAALLAALAAALDPETQPTTKDRETSP